MLNQLITSLTSIFIGIIFWTLMEYLLHSKLGHQKKLKNPFSVEHLRHHRDTNYFAKTYKKILAAIALLILFTTLFGLFLSWLIGISFSLGFSSMYLIYEITHRRCHTHAPVGFYGRWVRKHHFHHHFKNPKSNQGVTSPLWDIIFGTLEKPSIVMVPRKMALEWLLDPKTKELLPRFSNDYKLRGGTTAKL